MSKALRPITGHCTFELRAGNHSGDKSPESFTYARDVRFGQVAYLDVDSDSLVEIMNENRGNTLHFRQRQKLGANLWWHSNDVTCQCRTTSPIPNIRTKWQLRITRIGLLSYL